MEWKETKGEGVGCGGPSVMLESVCVTGWGGNDRQLISGEETLKKSQQRTSHMKYTIFSLVFFAVITKCNNKNKIQHHNNLTINCVNSSQK